MNQPPFEPRALYTQLLAILKDEELIRIRHRFKKAENVAMFQLMDEEIRLREVKEKEATAAWIQSLKQI